jgi:hypothetical protein
MDWERLRGDCVGATRAVLQAVERDYVPSFTALITASQVHAAGAAPAPVNAGASSWVRGVSWRTHFGHDA